MSLLFRSEPSILEEQLLRMPLFPTPLLAWHEQRATGVACAGAFPDWALVSLRAEHSPLLSSSQEQSSSDHPLTRYEQALLAQTMLRDGFLLSGVPMRADPDYSIIYHDQGFGGDVYR